MKKYNLITNECEEEDIYCYGCGKLIDGKDGVSIRYVEDENKNKIKVNYGRCCVGRIHASDSLSKQIREKYRSSKQIPDELLKKLPIAPKPTDKPSESSKVVDQFVDKMGRSKLAKTYDAKVKYKRNKSLKG